MKVKKQIIFDLSKRGSIFFCAMKEFSRLIKIMARLRGPGGCPWDRKQTHRTLIPYLIEEAYELIDEIKRQENDKIQEELGDLLLQVIFHCQLARERGRFNIEDVVRGLNEKLIRRHPHVFGKVHARNVTQVIRNWEKIKMNEHRGERKSILDGIARGLPALLRARRIQSRAEQAGFRWISSPSQLNRAIQFFVKSFRKKPKSQFSKGLGRLLFFLVDRARTCHWDPEQILNDANHEFERQIRKREKEIKKNRMEKRRVLIFN